MIETKRNNNNNYKIIINKNIKSEFRRDFNVFILQKNLDVLAVC